MDKWPEPNEIVVIKITKVLPYGAFADLLDYPNVQGFVHISQVASRWIKNIRNHVRPNQLRAAQVIRADKEKLQVDLSLVKVSESQQKAKIEEWEQSKRAKKILEIFAKQRKMSFDIAWKKIAEPLESRHGSLMNAFQEALITGKSALEGIPEELVEPFAEHIKKSITVPEKEVSKVVKIKSYEADAILKIKNAFRELLKQKEYSKIKATYIGGGKYHLSSKAPDYKSADKVLSSFAEELIKSIKKNGGTASIEK
ncbi:MAG: translation initiation factor IF-2 subunit alpha [Candidatus Diapherotrites archaeon]|nr:translation initiation factor IF-2 subunit alpha [Candidatus Diapherotrites archaeon]